MGGASSGEDFVSEINVTPFVDVMLVLLIIFMVTAPMMTEGLDVALPNVEASETLPTENDHAVLTIKADGALFLDEYETTAADLPSVLGINVLSAGRQLFVRADQNVPYGVVMTLMGKIRAAGVTNVGLVTLPEGPGLSGPALSGAGLSGAGLSGPVSEQAGGGKRP